MNLSPQVVDTILKVAERSATNRHRRARAHYGVTDDDARSFAVLQCLESAHKWEPNKGPAENYFSSVALRAVNRELKRKLLTNKTHSWYTLGEETVTPTPDEVAPNRTQTWTERVRRAVFAKLTDWEQTAVRLMFGFDDDCERKPREVAQVLGVEVSQVYHLSNKLRRYLTKDERLRELLLEGYESDGP